ncbi:hypothetical protein E2C01_020324 [Portunus trituberculatus]|uniref:Uncharacterized protein n=1 Tax=Portunus trituberculatus TaxID=210409 RepID=A0A5B7E177_PORTR|nr:hypothetical protein [Portunus trituberculatus]
MAQRQRGSTNLPAGEEAQKLNYLQPEILPVQVMVDVLKEIAIYRLFWLSLPETPNSPQSPKLAGTGGGVGWRKRGGPILYFYPVTDNAELYG